MSRLAAVAFATAALVFSALICAPPGHADPAVDSCVIIDTDFDIDDMMSIPTVLGARHVAAIVTTEGYTLPALGAAAVTRLVTEPGQRAIPVVVGAATSIAPAATTPAVISFFSIFSSSLWVGLF